MTVRGVAVSGGTALALALALAASMVLGAEAIAPDRVVTALTDYDASREHVIVVDVRLPRALLAAAVGAALAVAGAVMQALSRNPLAEPGLLGVAWGAALAAVVAQLALGVTSTGTLVWFAMLGAALAGLAVVVLGSLGRPGLTPAKLVIAGAVVSALLASLVQGVLVVDRESLEAARRWLAGSLLGRDVGVLVQTLPYLAAGFALAFALARPLTALELGEDVARGLGQRTRVTQGAAALAVVLLAGSAVAIAGPVVFVGLAVPHAARLLAGPGLRRTLPLSAALGALLVVVGDLAARLVVAPEELPVGVMTALVGVPLFMHIVRRSPQR